ncbi:hypothetical protein HUJ04_013590 [Dendroctonus ponderosae]|nr:hypothetical protein HUJ04_013590 [Dendroctonus ponderosae]
MEHAAPNKSFICTTMRLRITRLASLYSIPPKMHGLRRLMQGDSKHPKAPLGNNFRPPQPLHHRPVRTNIDFNVRNKAAAFPVFFVLKIEPHQNGQISTRNVTSAANKEVQSNIDVGTGGDNQLSEELQLFVRANQIDFFHFDSTGKQCPSMYKDVYYKGNSWKQH